MNTNESKTAHILTSTIGNIFILLTFLFPLFFINSTSEFFEINKLALLTVATSIITLLWIVKIVSTKSLIFVKSQASLIVLMYVAFAIIGTVFTLNSNISFVGRYGRWFPSLLSYGVLALFYFAITGNIDYSKLKQRFLSLLSATLTTASLVSLFSYFYTFLAANEIAPNVRYFVNLNTTGSNVTNTVFAVTAAFLLLNKLVQTDNKPISKILYTLGILINAATILFVGGGTLYIYAVTMALLFIVVAGKALKQNKAYAMFIVGVVTALIVLKYIPVVNTIYANPAYARESLLPLRETWVVVSSNLRDRPVLGSGLGTFSLNFARYRPMSMNSTNVWNVRYDKPANEVLNMLNDFGLAGVAFLILGAYLLNKTIKSITKTGSEDQEQRLIVTTLIVLTTSLLFTYANIAIVGVIVMVFAMASASVNKREQLKVHDLENVISGIINEQRTSSSFLPILLALPLLAAAVYLQYNIGKVYLAEIFFRRALIAANGNDGTAMLQNLGRAINLQPEKPEYRNTSARISIALAAVLSRNENISDTQKQLVQNLVANAIRESRISTEVLSPLNPNSWDTRAAIYRSLIGVAKDAEQWTVNAYENAIRLDPTNPILRVQAGGVFLYAKDYLNAANLFRQATNLKPDYANAYYNLAQALIGLQNFEQAERALQITAQLIQNNAGELEVVNKQLQEVSAKAQQQREQRAAQQTQTQNNVEDIAQEAVPVTNEQVTTQEPLQPADNIETVNQEALEQ